MIKIICIGKLKETFWKEASKEYLKRLTKYTKIQIIEIKEAKIDDKKLILAKEKQALLANLKDSDYIILLDIKGTKLNSITLANKLTNLLIHNHNLTFIIGSSNGVHQEIKDKAHFTLSFSDLTFPHQLFRIILLEQLYRTFKIINKETYHK